MENKKTKVLVEAGICIALSFILGFIVLFKMPLGGSVTLASRLPIIIYSIRWGFKKGILAAAILGLLEMLLGGYVIHPIQAILDYILSYAAMAIGGLKFFDKFKKKTLNFIPSIILAYLVSGAFNVISGLIYFNDMTYASKAGFKTFLPYALSYNYSFLAADCLILVLIFVISFNRLKSLYKKQY